jgi:Na+-transporting NADH:ubiquinone oxidoreductase subunit A
MGWVRMRELSYELRKGLDLTLPGAPHSSIDEGARVSHVAVLGSDYPGVRPRVVVREAERVRTGQTLVIDRRRPEVCITSPAAGKVAIDTGSQMRLNAIVVTVEDEDADAGHHAVPDPDAVTSAALEDLEHALLASGLWTALRTRPFGNIPDPGTRPADIFVTAVDTHPLAPPPPAVIAAREREFTLGLAALVRLTEGWLYLCQAPGPMLPRPEHEQIVVARFAGPHPAGLPGTHIHLLGPVSLERTVWHVGYQDVIAIGALLVTGRLPVERVVALAGPGVHRPRLIRTRIGAALEELVAGELVEGTDPRAYRIVSGSPLAGRAVNPDEGYLGRMHQQVCVLPASPTGDWVLAGDGPRHPFVVIPDYERVMPLDLLPAPLLRALLIQDDDAAVALGALELDEEDLALLSYVCPSRQDYGRLLRATLSRLEARA